MSAFGGAGFDGQAGRLQMMRRFIQGEMKKAPFFAMKFSTAG